MGWLDCVGRGCCGFAVLLLALLVVALVWLLVVGLGKGKRKRKMEGVTCDM